MQLEPAEREHFERIFAAPSEKVVRDLSPEAFTRFVAYLYDRDGEYEAIVVEGSEDGGIDIELWSRDAVNRALIMVVQCKRYNTQEVKRVDIERFIEALRRARVEQGAFFTVQGYKSGARDAARVHQPRIRLFDVGDLLSWIAAISTRETQPVAPATTSGQEATLPFVPAVPGLAPGSVGPRLEHGEATLTPPIICVTNNKGGIGKTTLVGNLAGALSAAGLQVLVIDADPQANLTSWLANQRDRPAAVSLYAVLVDEHPLWPLVRPALEPRIFIVPGSPLLDDIPRELPAFTLARRLATAIAALPPAEPRLDFILIDTPPALGLLTRSALVAATHLLLPFELDNHSFAGVQRLLNFVVETEESFALTPRAILGGVASRVHPDTRLSRMFSTSIAREATKHPRLQAAHISEQHFWLGELRDLEDFRRAVNQRHSIVAHNPASEAARQVIRLAQEVRRRVAATPAPR